MGNMKTQQNTCFWKEINEYNILIPNYQRDYAQGRKDGGRIDNIRQIFVSELYQALSEDETSCHLGLVFGSYNEDTETFVAVDGQQRLTTVFLLHWFVSWKENKLSEYKDTLKKFQWNTRSYSSQFVNLLFTLEPSDNVISAITENCNYFSIWENDPTVKSMKIMLTEIEKQYPNKQQLCDSLFSVGCKIQYDILKLEKESDARTYLKMNSRGRPLTTFENFKSNLITYFEIETKKFDNEWLDFMLERSKTEDGGFRDPDVQFMNYINEYTYLQSKLKEQNDSKLFIEAKLKDGESDVPFISFEKYKSIFDKDIIEKFEKSLDWIVRYYDAIEKIDRQIDFDSDFYLEMIIKDNKPDYSHRIKFFSLLKYAELSEYSKLDETSFRRWTRVFRNLVENSEIYEDEMTNVSKSINEINDKNIYSYLSKGNILKGFNQDQIAEEVAKVKQILDKNGECRRYEGDCTKKDDSTYNTWEEIIIEAENYAFFKGAIRFLFQNEKGEIDLDESKTWNTENFDTKLKNAKEYFDADGLSEKYHKAVTKTFVSYCNKKNQIKDKHIFSKNSVNWKEFLCSDNWSLPISIILQTSPSELDKRQLPAVNTDYVFNCFDDAVFEYIIKTIPESRFHRYGSWFLGLYREGGRDWPNSIIFDWDTIHRNKYLSELSKSEVIQIDKENIIEGCTTLCRGDDIKFKFCSTNKIFVWTWKNEIKSAEDEESEPVFKSDFLSEYTEEKLNEIKKKLNELQ